MKGFHERRRSPDSSCLCTVFTNHGSTPSVCLFPCWSVAINLLTNLAGPLNLDFSVGLVCSKTPWKSRIATAYSSKSPFSPPELLLLLRATVLRLPLGEIRRFLGRPRHSEGLSDQRIESRVPAENHLHLILAERPSPQVMACLTSAAATRCA